MKGLFTHTTKSVKTGFGKSPEAFNSVDMTLALDKFILPMVNPKMFFVTNINESVIAFSQEMVAGET